MKKMKYWFEYIVDLIRPTLWVIESVAQDESRFILSIHLSKHSAEKWANKYMKYSPKVVWGGEPLFW